MVIGLILIALSITIVSAEIFQGGGDTDQYPVITLLSPSNNSWSVNQTNFFNFTISDDYGFTNYTFNIWYANGTVLNNTNSNTTVIINATTYNITFNTSLDGNFLWNVLVFDNDTLGAKSAYATNNYTIKIDTSSPVISSFSTPSCIESGDTKIWSWMQTDDIGILVSDCIITLVNGTNVTFSSSSIQNATIVTCSYKFQGIGDWNVWGSVEDGPSTTTENVSISVVAGGICGGSYDPGAGSGGASIVTGGSIGIDLTNLTVSNLSKYFPGFQFISPEKSIEAISNLPIIAIGENVLTERPKLGPFSFFDVIIILSSGIVLYIRLRGNRKKATILDMLILLGIIIYTLSVVITQNPSLIPVTVTNITNGNNMFII